MDSTNLTPHVIVLWGDEGCWKTTFGLSYPKPIVHLETDVGGFNRAAWRIDTKGITSTTYTPPVPMEESGVKKITVKFPKKLMGIKELWQQIFLDYVRACRDPKVSTIVIDSATELWTICHRGYLQELQENQLAAGKTEAQIRENLIPVEYADPNARMRQLINAAKSYQKYLVLTHYSKDVYVTVQKGDKTESMPSGEITIDGFKDTGKLVDLVVRLDLTKTGEVEAKIVKKCALAGMGTTALGMTLPEPSYQGLVDLRNMLAGE
jgi:hypothetical protein